MCELYLTLTSVVFESDTNIAPLYADNLTLTSVVFELNKYYLLYLIFIFNFNKCCI